MKSDRKKRKLKVKPLYTAQMPQEVSKSAFFWKCFKEVFLPSSIRLIIWCPLGLISMMLLYNSISWLVSREMIFRDENFINATLGGMLSGLSTSIIASFSEAWEKMKLLDQRKGK